jgi:hypothetical protein
MSLELYENDNIALRMYEYLQEDFSHVKCMYKNYICQFAMVSVLAIYTSLIVQG